MSKLVTPTFEGEEIGGHTLCWVRPEFAGESESAIRMTVTRLVGKLHTEMCDQIQGRQEVHAMFGDIVHHG